MAGGEPAMIVAIEPFPAGLDGFDRPAAYAVQHRFGSVALGCE